MEQHASVDCATNFFQRSVVLAELEIERRERHAHRRPFVELLQRGGRFAKNAAHVPNEHTARQNMVPFAHPLRCASSRETFLMEPVKEIAGG